MGNALDIFQAYPLGTLEVDCERYGRATLLGIYSHKQYSLRLRDESGALFSMMPDVVKPVLCGFDQLCTPLADGTTIPAAVELIQAAGYAFPDYHADEPLAVNSDGFINIYQAIGTGIAQSYEIMPDGILIVWQKALSQTSYDTHNMADWMRAHGYALPVNGKPLVEGTDYIRKEA